MSEIEDKWVDITLFAVKGLAFWLFGMLFYVICGFELTLLCLLVKIAGNTGKK